MGFVPWVIDRKGEPKRWTDLTSVEIQPPDSYCFASSYSSSSSSAYFLVCLHSPPMSWQETRRRHFSLSWVFRGWRWNCKRWAALMDSCNALSAEPPSIYCVLGHKPGVLSMSARFSPPPATQLSPPHPAQQTLPRQVRLWVLVVLSPHSLWSGDRFGGYQKAPGPIPMLR